MGFKIIVDSCCDMTPQMASDPVFHKVPLTISCGGSTFVDDRHLDQNDLLWAIKQSGAAPTTACPSPQTYMEAMDCVQQDVYVVTLSALLSGSHNSAEQGRMLLEEEQPERNVHVFNTCSASAGETLTALKIRELAGSGMPFKRVVREVERFIYEMQTFFVLESLETLRKAGRLTRLQATITGALRIKLFMGATPEGEICKLGQALSIKQALAKLVERMEKDETHRGRHLVISHCNCLERAFSVKEQVEARCGFSKITVVDTGGISTVYANDGGIVCSY